MTRPLLCCAPLALLVAGCASDPPRVIPPPSADLSAVGPAAEYLVGPGDVLRVNVYGHPDLSSQILRDNAPGSPVDGAGRIQLPLVGAVEVGGMTVLEVRAAVSGALRQYLKEPRVDVAVTEFGAHRFVVLGALARPGVYQLKRPITALEALAGAGGFASTANRDQVVWMRGGLAEENLVMLDGNALDGNAAGLISPGDVIFVGRRTWADRAEAVRDVIPFLQAVSIPISTAAAVVALGNLL